MKRSRLLPGRRNAAGRHETVFDAGWAMLSGGVTRLRRSWPAGRVGKRHRTVRARSSRCAFLLADAGHAATTDPGPDVPNFREHYGNSGVESRSWCRTLMTGGQDKGICVAGTFGTVPQLPRILSENRCLDLAGSHSSGYPALRILVTFPIPLAARTSRSHEQTHLRSHSSSNDRLSAPRPA
jgi:hypothetical protein